VVRVVFDTVGFVRGLINPSSRWGRILFVHADDYRLVLSREIVEEVLAVLERPSLARRFSTLAGRDARAVLALIADAESVELSEIPNVSRDQNDDMILATARAANADFLVTEVKDLLVLGAYAGIPIITAEAFLSVLESEDYLP
jgi:putative PIN family toxin of toxin-antitoxin system